MRFKDLAVGKYVTLNRWLNDHHDIYAEILETVYIPKTKDDGMVGCRQVTRYGSIRSKDKYVDDTIIYINYTHLLEVENNPYDCLNWVVGDILVPTKCLVKVGGEQYAAHSPYIIDKVVDDFIGYLRIFIHSHDDVINCDYVASPLYFKKKCTN